MSNKTIIQEQLVVYMKLNIRSDEKHLNQEVSKKMIPPFYFTDRNLKMGFKVNLDIRQIIHANSKLSIAPIYNEFRNEVRYNNKIIKELSVIYARSINQYKFKNQTFFSSNIDKQGEKK